MDKKFWERNHERLGGGTPSLKTLRMASGQLVDSEVTWEWVIEMEGVSIRGTFEPLQAAFSAVHDYKQDVVSIEAEGKRASLENQQGEPWWKNFKPAGSIGMRAAFTGVLSYTNTPARRVHFMKRLTCNDLDKHHTLETILKDVEGEEVADTTGITEVTKDEEGETSGEITKGTRERQAWVEEVEDEERAPSRLRTEVYLWPEEAWPTTRTDSPGASTTPRTEGERRRR
ncbi:hypothetical protein K438DRAFT_1788628 [Mycena galopus ATCC 62051]|nr:hypothetical protein K438DRAFT_1788628 [Mycena galopus ATCC 62051]